MDLDELRLPQDAVQFMKNLTANVGQNPESTVLAGANMEIFKPLEGNTELLVALPDGLNYCVGFYSSEQTNEGYFFIWNSNTDHSIWVISGDIGTIRKVYQSSLLPFELKPEDFISEGRCTVELRSFINPATGLEDNYKFLIFTNNQLRQYYISVQDSIATNSFTSSPYFDGAGTFYDPATLVHLGVPTPLSCIGIAPVTPSGGDEAMQNLIVRTALQFRVKFIDVFGRESEHGIISNDYISIVGGGCISAANNMPRCVDLSFDAGNPLVDTIQIEYRTWVGNDTGSSLQSGWVKYDTINKWINVPGQQWYQRAPNIAYYDVTTNKITYRFCGDKSQEPIPDSETARVQPGLPIVSNGVLSLNKRIVLSNNVHDFQPIDPAQIAKVTYAPVIPPDTPCAVPEIHTMIVYANIYRPYNDASGIIRKSNDMIVFGNEDGDCAGATGNSFRMDQVFGDQENPGFIFYLAGTQYNCIAQWGDLDIGTGIFTPMPAYPGSFTHQPMCQIRISAPAGKYVLRGASHKAKISDTNYQSTSTYIAGYTTLNAAYSSLTGANARRNYASNPIKELIIDITGGNVTYNQPTDPMFVILDLTGTEASATDGYLHEQIDNGIPVEMAPVNFFKTGCDTYGSFFTDHNGFFFGMSNAGLGQLFTLIAANLCDGSGTTVRKTIINNDYHMRHGDGTGTPSGPCTFGGLGNWMNQIYLVSAGSSFPDTGRRTITQSVFSCSSTTGVPNLPIIMTKGAVALTDVNGKAEIIAHNRYNYTSISWGVLFPQPFLSSLLPNYASSPNADDVIIFTQRGTCRWTACGGCTPSMANAVIVYIDCCSSTPTCRDTTMANVFISLSAVNIKGVQSGGKYGVGFVLFDEIGRRTFFQVGQGDAAFVTMPNLNDSGYQKFLPPSIGYAIGASFSVSSVFKKMAFGVTANLLFSDFFSWSADWVQLVDNTGTTNTINPTQVRIYYGSLAEYNKQNNLSTNCNWQFIATGNNNQGAPVVGDIVQFIVNGNGDWVDAGVSSPVTYDSNGYFFTIDYQAAFSTLTNGCLFRVVRPIETLGTTNIYYEQCMVIDLENGTVPTDKLTGTIPYVDSYILARQLPVPILQGQPGAIPPGGSPTNPIQYTNTSLDPALVISGYSSSNANNSNGVIIKSVNDALTSFPFYFESPSPSDFWGSHLSNRGRISTNNPQEAQQRIGTEIMLSAALGDRGTYNGLSYFDTANTYVFDRNTWGNITAILVQINRCLVICENDHFFVDYNTSNLQINEAGNVTAQSQYGPFTTPSRPSGTAFGCSQQDINTIRKYVGTVMWVDHSGFLVMNDFIKSIDVSTSDPKSGVIGGYSGYLRNKISALNILNQNSVVNGISFLIGSIDPRTSEYYLSSFNYPANNAIPEYLNVLPFANILVNETKIIDLNTGMLKGDAAFTPEMGGLIPSYYSGGNFFTFKQGVPWKHHQGADSISPGHCSFYGAQTPCYVVPVVNPGSETVKRYFWIEVYTKQNVPVQQNLPDALFYCESIDTEKGQASRLAVQRFIIRDGFQSAEFLCDLNTPTDPNLLPMTSSNRLTDGNPLIGRWLRATLKTNDNWSGSYFEFSGIITGINDIKISGT